MGGGGGGEIAFVGRENVKNIQKTNKICYCLGGGGIQNLGGEISPPKGPEKNTGQRFAVYIKRTMNYRD